MPQAYCTRCQAAVTVRGDACLLGHPIDADTSTRTVNTGRHRAQKRPTRRLQARSLLAAAAAPRPPRPVPTTPAAPVVVNTPPRTPLRFAELLGFSEPGGMSAVTAERPPTETEAPRTGEAEAPRVAVTRTATGRPATVPPPRRPARPSLFDSLPKLSELASGDQHENTGTLIERLWHVTDEHEEQDEWMSEGTSGMSIDRVGMRTRIIGAGLLLVVALTAIGIRLAGREPAVPTDPVAEAVAAASASIPQARDIADLIADPDAGGDALSDAAVSLTALDSASRNLNNAAADDGEVPAPAALQTAADLSDRIEGRLGDALTYRLQFAQTFRLPPLPTNADVGMVADVGFEISAMLSDTRRVVESLPRDPSLDPHRLAALDALTDIDAITVVYLQALRNRDLASTTRLTSDIRIIAAGIHDDLDAPLAEVGGQVHEMLDEYQALLRQAGR